MGDVSSRTVDDAPNDAEQQRRRSNQFETLFNEAPLGVYLIDEDFRICAVNPIALPVFGDIPHLIGRDFYEVIHVLWPKAYADEIVAVFRHTLETGEPYIVPERIEERLDRGVIEYYEWRINRIPLPEGRYGVVCYFRDISAQVQARRALAASENRFRFLAESVPQKIFTATASGEVDYFNRQWMEFTGLSFDQIKKWGWTQFIHPDDVEENVQRWKRSIDTGQPFELEHRFRRHDGMYRWHLSRAQRMFDADGNGTMWIGSNTDIDDVKRTAEGLRASEAQNRMLFQSVPAAVFTCDKDGVVQDYNRRAQEYWGRAPKRGDPAERFCGSFKLYLPDGTPLPHEQSPMVDVLRDGMPRENVEVVIERPDHSRLPAIVNFLPLTDAEGEITGAITCFSDITQVKRFEREREALLANEQAARLEAEAANRAKDVFLATLSHEMRTPLNAIVGWMSILRQKGCTEDDLHEGLDVIDRNIRAQVQLIEDVLDVSRIVSGKLRLDVRSCDLSAALREALDVVRPAAEAKGVSLKADFDPSACAASCDTGRMQQVVWNLLTNAVKFTPKGGRITITLVRQGSMTRITVTDTGTGISPEFLPYVFDRFRQADSTSRRKFGGLGLGLSIVKHLVEMHGGTVWAKSAGEGKGSTFTIDLPVRGVRAVESPDGDSDATGDERRAGKQEEEGVLGLPHFLPTATIRLDGFRVLVVDDEADARRLVQKVLEGAGASVTTATSAAEALETIKEAQGGEGRPQLLVSDLGMPEVDGYDLIRRLRDAGHTMEGLPAVALSAYAHRDDERRALLAGFQVHIPKPVDPQDLIAVVARLCLMNPTGGLSKH